jgi:hypothetical protein
MLLQIDKPEPLSSLEYNLSIAQLSEIGKGVLVLEGRLIGAPVLARSESLDY